MASTSLLLVLIEPGLVLKGGEEEEEEEEEGDT
jgi:hypothetical protein